MLNAATPALIAARNAAADLLARHVSPSTGDHLRRTESPWCLLADSAALPCEVLPVEVTAALMVLDHECHLAITAHHAARRAARVSQ